MAEGPLVSVIVPVFNGERTIAETLESAAAQSWRNLEIIIVNDGSTDSASHIAEEFCRREPRARVVTQSNAGLAAARNRAIDEASGEWIAPLDADDLWHPLKIERQVAAARSVPRSGVVYNWTRLIDGHGRFTRNARTSRAEGEVLREHLAWNFIGNGSTPLINRGVLGDLRYDPRINACADYLLQLRLAARTRFACVPAYLTGYRVTNTNMSADALRMIREHIELYRLLAPELPRGLRRRATGEIARWQTRHALVSLRRGNAAEGLLNLYGALVRNPLIAVSESVERVARAGRRAAVPRKGRHFNDLDPDKD